jgi:hypothetical protein
MGRRKVSGAQELGPGLGLADMMPEEQSRFRLLLKLASAGTIDMKELDVLTEFSPLMCHLVMKAIQTAPTMSGAIERMRILRVRANEWIESEYGGDYVAFRLDWLVARMGIPLQARLLVEQVLWDKGKPWAQLCSGFRPG